MTPLAEIIAQDIRENGPMRFDRYMELCLGHPEHGYYMSQTPFGVQGDFTTAPEISQIFGELIGAWVVDTWVKMGAPDPFILLECGPGRGTLMADALRAVKTVPHFINSCEIHFLESSDALRQVQKKALDGFNVQWHTDLETLPDHAPVIVVGNEFLDALPIRHFTFNEASWFEKYIEINKNGTFQYCQKKLENADIVQSSSNLFTAALGDHLEVSLEQRDFIRSIIRILQKQHGTALFIDYGYATPLYGESLQAVMNHEYVSPLAHVGMADITAHVNFADLGDLILSENMTLYGPTSQSSFLKTLGIDVRAGHLKQGASETQAVDIDNAVDRLTGRRDSKTQMGELFKVMAFTANPDLEIEGFS